MDTTHTAEIDYTEMEPAAISRLLRGMVAMRMDAAFMAREQVNLAEMTEQADALYNGLMRHGFSAAQIAKLIPGVEVFA